MAHGFAGEGELHEGSITDFLGADDAQALLAQMRGLLDSRRAAFAAEFTLHHRSGDARWASAHGSRFIEAGSDVQRLILQVQDITARRKAEDGLQYIAFHDSLTGLPNRHRFQQALTGALERSRVEGDKPFAPMFLDFDRFKLINDSLGHAVGDEFLVAVAGRIRHQLRPSDTVARLGGDEFAILAVDLHCERYATLLADRLLEALHGWRRRAGDFTPAS